MFCICLVSAASLFPAVIFGSVAMGGSIFCPCLITAWRPEGLISHCIGGGLAEMFGSYFLYEAGGESLLGLCLLLTSRHPFFSPRNFLPWNVLRSVTCIRNRDSSLTLCRSPALFQVLACKHFSGGCSESRAIISGTLIHGAQQCPESPT